MAYDTGVNSRATNIRIEHGGTTNNAAVDFHVRDMERVGHGSNDVQMQTNENGETVLTTGTLREFYRYAERASEEIAAQSTVRAQGLPGYQAGHIIGHRFILNQGLENLFPQDANFNTSAYKTLENEMADWVAAGADVHFEIKLSDYDVNGRPETVEVSYTATNNSLPDAEITQTVIFSNEPDQMYNRTSKNDIIDKFTQQDDL